MVWRHYRYSGRGGASGHTYPHANIAGERHSYAVRCCDQHPNDTDAQPHAACRECNPNCNQRTVATTCSAHANTNTNSNLYTHCNAITDTHCNVVANAHCNEQIAAGGHAGRPKC